jgi:hypothetical protein
MNTEPGTNAQQGQGGGSGDSNEKKIDSVQSYLQAQFQTQPSHEPKGPPVRKATEDPPFGPTKNTGLPKTATPGGQKALPKSQSSAALRGSPKPTNSVFKPSSTYQMRPRSVGDDSLKNKLFKTENSVIRTVSASPPSSGAPRHRPAAASFPSSNPEQNRIAFDEIFAHLTATEVSGSPPVQKKVKQGPGRPTINLSVEKEAAGPNEPQAIPLSSTGSFLQLQPGSPQVASSGPEKAAVPRKSYATFEPSAAVAARLGPSETVNTAKGELSNRANTTSPPLSADENVVPKRHLSVLRGMLQCAAVEKVWRARKVQRAYDHWVMFTNDRIAREIADKIASSRKQEEELHGASLRKITQEFVRVSEKMTGFDRKEKMLQARTKSLESKVEELEKERRRLKSENETLQETVESKLLASIEGNAQVRQESPMQTGPSTNAARGPVRSAVRQSDDEIMNSIAVAMEDSLRALAPPSGAPIRRDRGTNEIVAARADQVPRRKDEAQPVIRYDDFPLDSSAGSTGQRPEIPLTPSVQADNSNDGPGLTMDELHSIHERMLAGISHHNIDIEGLFTARELKRGQPIAEFVQLLLDCGLGLNILKGRELADFLSMLDARGNGIIDVQMFLQFLDINTHLQDGAGQKLVEYSVDHGRRVEESRHKSKKEKMIGDFLHSRRRPFNNVYKNFANTNSSRPWMDFERWMRFTRNSGFITGYLSRRDVENVFLKLSQTMSRPRISFKYWIVAMKRCADVMTGPYPAAEDRLAWLFKRMTECGQRIPGTPMFLERMIGTRDVHYAPQVRSEIPRQSFRPPANADLEAASFPPSSIDNPLTPRGNPLAVNPDHIYHMHTLNLHHQRSPSSRSVKSDHSLLRSSTRVIQASPMDKLPTRNISKNKHEASLEDLSSREVASLRAALIAVVKDPTASLLRNFLTLSPSPALSYTRFTRLIRESLKRYGHSFSGAEAAYLLRTVDPHGDGIIHGTNLKAFLGLQVLNSQQWGSPQVLANSGGSPKNSTASSPRERLGRPW